jgi:hypothetical protein
LWCRRSVKRARAAAAAELHAEAEQEAADRDLHARRRQRPADPLAHDLTRHQERREQHHGEAQHHQLGEHTRHVALDDCAAVGGGEAEGGVVEADPEQRADHQERAVAPALAAQSECARDHRGCRHERHGALPGRQRGRWRRHVAPAHKVSLAAKLAAQSCRGLANCSAAASLVRRR